jgi:hypothetical protein
MTARRMSSATRDSGERKSGPFTIPEVLALPALVNIETAARCLSIGRDKAHRMIRDGEFPVATVPLGARQVCRLVDICEFLKIPYPYPAELAATAPSATSAA